MKSSFTSLGLSLAAAGALAAGLFVRSPVSPSKATKPIATTKGPSQAPLANVKPIAIASPIANGPGVAAMPSTGGRAFTVDVLAVASWGDGPSDLGRTLPSEASPEAPMSLTVDTAGNVYVLDQVNERVQIYPPTGGAPRAVHIPSRVAQDLVVDPAGGLVLLDRLVDRALIFTDAAGKERKRVQLVGPGVSEGGAVTALFAAPDGFWVELEHTTVVRVALPNGDPDPVRPTREGRPTIGGSGVVLRAARDPQGAAMVSAIAPSGSSSSSGGFVARVPFDRPVLQLAGLEGDAAGNVWLAAHLARETPIPPYGLYDDEVSVVELSPDGVELGRVTLPAPEGDAEQLRPLVVGADGAVYHLHVGLGSATLRRVR